jgi:hypothetical protein
MEDETIISTDQLLDQYHKDELKPKLTDLEEYLKHMDDVVRVPKQEFRIPHGDKNYVRLSNTNPCDLLTHIQKGLNTKNLCIIQLITGELHDCDLFNPKQEYSSANNRNCEACLSKWIIDKKW